MLSLWRYEQASAGFRRRSRARSSESGFHRPATTRQSHHYAPRQSFAQTVVPNHRQIDRGTLRAILRQTEITADDLIKLL